MKLLGQEDDQVDVRLGLDQMMLLRNLLDEICHGFEFSEEEFSSIFDVQRAEAEDLLRRFDGVLERLRLTLDLE